MWVYLHYLAAELLNLVQHLVEVFIELLELQHCGGIALLEVQANGQ